MKLSVIVFGYDYDYAETIWTNTDNTMERYIKGQAMGETKMRITDDFERMIVFYGAGWDGQVCGFSWNRRYTLN